MSHHFRRFLFICPLALYFGCNWLLLAETNVIAPHHSVYTTCERKKKSQETRQTKQHISVSIFASLFRNRSYFTHFMIQTMYIKFECNTRIDRGKLFGGVCARSNIFVAGANLNFRQNETHLRFKWNKLEYCKNDQLLFARKNVQPHLNPSPLIARLHEVHLPRMKTYRFFSFCGAYLSYLKRDSHQLDLSLLLSV